MTVVGTHTRRAFMRSVAGFAAVGAGGPLAMQLTALASASSASAATNDYKALVCVYLGGGIDNLHTLVPTDSDNYANLQKIRADLLPDKAGLLSIKASSQSGYSVALNASLPNIRSIYNAGRLAIIPNVGVLDRPLTRLDLEKDYSAMPAAAGSHNDGTSIWHTFGIEGARYGWGGLMLDSLLDMKSTSFASISTGFYNPFGSGRRTEQFRIYPDGIVENFAGANANQLAYLGSPAGGAVVKRIATEVVSKNLLSQQFTALTKRTFDGVVQIQSALDGAKDAFPIVRKTRPGDQTMNWKFNPLLDQLRVVARMIKQRSQFSVNRQIFFVELGGFDLHGGLNLGMNTLLNQLDTALGYFDDCLGEMGMRDQVLTFTTSEFGRSLPSNGDGSDHGWGGVEFLMGGGIKGGQLIGELPNLHLKGPDVTPSRGVNLIPKIAVQQVAGTVGTWFGLSASQLGEIIPNIGRFSSSTLAV